ncbi:hypothetical protein PV05_10524 [Exophiala xenobiotica]|uniref:HAD hydrolase, family IA n=1 Tax=Exophiala xenobiotica TaxID=348802 RepID=A0A0D2EVF6_9EURO|nr:uncharacterized protein PV05_10524 [Exophiala xenobiotica]KIW51839.1 hypothetical protein PV05_10524 [Exophiala xenobiotica]
MSAKTYPPYKFIFFDCDNTLVESEDLAFNTTANLVNEILEKHGKTERYTPETLIRDFCGFNFRSMMPVLCQRQGIKMDPEELTHYAKLEEERVVAMFAEKGKPCDGSLEVLEKLHSEGKYKLAVVSSSALGRIRAQMKKTGHDKFFDEDCVFSAQNSMDVPSSKPSPAVYLHAMEKLGAKPNECLAVEDSVSGCRAAVKARIPTIGYVGAYHTGMAKHQMLLRLIDAGCKAILWDWENWNTIFEEMAPYTKKK